MADRKSMSFDVARELLTEPCACFKLVTAHKHITLLPRFIGNFNAGIIEQLNSRLLEYDDSLDGVLIAYRHVRRLQQNGRLVEHLPHVHLDIQADFIVFQPSLGAVLQGVINKQSKDHIGILVHGLFNGSIRKPRSAAGSGDLDSASLLGQTVLFEVTKLYTFHGVLSFNGQLTDESLDQLCSKRGQKRKSEDIEDDMSIAGTADSEEPHTPSQEKPKKKKKKKDKEERKSLDESMDTSQSEPATPNDSPMKKKKKNKSKEETVLSPKTPANFSMFLNIPSSTPVPVMASLDTEEPTKSKKKRKRADISAIVDEKDSMSVGSNDSGLGFVSTSDSTKKKKHKKNKEGKDASHLDGSVFETSQVESKVKSENISAKAEFATSVDSSMDESLPGKKKKKHKKLKKAKAEPV